MIPHKHPFKHVAGLRFSLLVVMTFLLASNSLTADPGVAVVDEKARQERIRWWRDGRFGMFIHWGLYAIPAGEWKGSVHETGYSEWIQFEEKIPAKEYQQLARKFNPVKFDPDAWVALANAAGMKYVVLTAKHHDGFSLYDSKLTGFDIMDATPFKRDVVKELSIASRKKGLRFGCYYSVDRDWHRPTGPGNRLKQTNTWDYPESPPADFDTYFNTFAKPQVEEILTLYKPDLLWFDGIDMKSAAQVESLYQSIRRRQPGCIINSRIRTFTPPASFPPPYGDYYSSGDNEVLKDFPGFEWENPASTNTSFGYNKHDKNWVKPGTIIHRLVNIISKNGNYLLNVGPTAEGIIPEECARILTEVGQWMKINGEALEGTMPMGANEDPNFRLMSKGNVVYALCLTWPDKPLSIPLPKRKTVRSVHLLGSGETGWKQSNDTVAISPVQKKPCDHAWVYRIELTP